MIVTLSIQTSLMLIASCDKSFFKAKTGLSVEQIFKNKYSEL